jgi:hypothetical protein
MGLRFRIHLNPGSGEDLVPMVVFGNVYDKSDVSRNFTSSEIFLCMQ